jgi:hypothetical protein
MPIHNTNLPRTSSKRLYYKYHPFMDLPTPNPALFKWHRYLNLIIAGQRISCQIKASSRIKIVYDFWNIYMEGERSKAGAGQG